MPKRIKQITASQAADLMPDLARLFAQLSPGTAPLKSERVQISLQSPNVIVLGAFEDGKLVGTATMVLAPLLNKTIGFIESVVVDEMYRGQGFGLDLMRKILELAQERGLSACNLTSSPDRIKANALYKELGFVLRETNVYRYRF
ncbi:MAG: GNAT family N-acetyltransferase [Patescibacteria group bacterium]